MSRKSPSGPLGITDQQYALAEVNDVSTLAPGDYLLPTSGALSLILGLFGSSFIPAAGADELIIFSGPETAKGRIGRARIWFAGDPTSAGSEPITLQWMVNGVPVGDKVIVPWTTDVPTDIPTTYALVRGTEYDFGDVFWDAGDIVTLAATVKTTPIGTSSLAMGIAYDKNYDR